MPIAACVDSIDAVPDNLRAYYRSENDKFVLDVEPVDGFALDNVEGLRNAFGRTKAELATVKQALDGFKGLTANRVRESLRELDRLKAVDPENEADKLSRVKISSAIEEAERKHAVALKESTDEADRLWGALSTSMVASQAKDAIVQHGGSPELLMPHILGRAKVDRKTLELSVFSEDGTPKFRRNGSDVSPAGIEDLVMDLKANVAFGRAFEADKSGSGATGPGRSMGGAGAHLSGNPWARDSFNMTEQCRILKTDPARAAHLKSVAGARV